MKKIIVFLLLLVGCEQKVVYIDKPIPINKEIIIYFNGKPLHISVDGSGQEMAEGHNYETGIGYTMRRFGSNIVINAKYDPMPPQPAFDSTAKITFECDGLDSLLLDSINNGTKQIKFILNGSK